MKLLTGTIVGEVLGKEPTPIDNDIVVGPYNGGPLWVAYHELLDLWAEGSSEREARDALMVLVWARIARMLEAIIQADEPSFTLAEMIEDLREIKRGDMDEVVEGESSG